MIRFSQALLTGIFFTFILDFLFFLGIKLHYLDFHKIPEFYNVLFADHQNILYFIPFVMLIGFVTTYIEGNKTALITLVLLFAAALSTLIPSVGLKAGEMLLQKADARFEDGRYIYKGTLFYEGRQKLYLFDDELGYLITLDKKDLK